MTNSKEIAVVEQPSPEDTNGDVPEELSLETLEKNMSSSTHIFFFLLLALLVAFGTWASVRMIDIVSQVQGEVVPSSQIQAVQHLEGGIIKRILVKEGQVVERGQTLVELKTTANDADVGELQSRVVGLTVDIARLTAASNNLPAIPKVSDLEVEYPKLMQEARRQFKIGRENHKQDLESQKEAIAQKKHKITEVSARLRNKKKRLKLLNEQISISTTLLKDNIATRYEHLNLLKEANSLQSDIEEGRALFHQMESSLKEERAKLAKISSNYKNKAVDELEELRQRLRETTNRLAKYKDNLQRTTVTAPMDGIVKTLYLVTLGGVVKPGGTILDMVPINDKLVIDARLPIQDVGYISTNQSATIRLASNDANRFGVIEGKVVSISPDTLISDSGGAYYKIRIETEKNTFQSGDFTYRLYPGMIISASIHTDQRTIADYFLSPFLSTMGTALGER
jgi:membrane fusion protein, adhesin transport system